MICMTGLVIFMRGLIVKEADILYEKGPYWICKYEHGFKVFKSGITHSTICATIGFKGAIGMEKAKREIERRLVK